MDPLVLREREEDLVEMEKEAYLDHQDPRESQDCKDSLDWQVPKETEVTKGMLVKRVMMVPEV